MTLREPLVIISGQVQQLPSGDTINGVPASTGITGKFEATNNEAGALILGSPVFIGADDGVSELSANSANSVKYAGLASDASVGAGNTANVQYAGVLTGNESQWAAVGISGNLVAGTTYFVSDAATGNLTATAPTTVASYVIPVGLALNATDLLLVQKTIIKL